MSELTRRGVLGVMASAPALSAIPAAASPASFFQIALAEFRSLHAADEAFYRYQVEPAHEEARRRMETAPHVTAFFDMLDGGEYSLTTRSSADVTTARRVTERIRGAGSLDRYNRACRTITAGALRRDRQEARIKRELGLASLDDRMEALGRRTYDALWVAIECPVETHGDLVAKLELLRIEEMWDAEPAQEAIVADVRRLGGLA